jgi:hypothetical protein
MLPKGARQVIYGRMGRDRDDNASTAGREVLAAAAV